MRPCGRRRRFEPHADCRLSQGKRVARGFRIELRRLSTGSPRIRRMAQIGVGTNSVIKFIHSWRCRRHAGSEGSDSSPPIVFAVRRERQRLPASACTRLACTRQSCPQGEPVDSRCCAPMRQLPTAPRRFAFGALRLPKSLFIKNSKKSGRNYQDRQSEPARPTG